jgi:Ion channel
MPEDTTSRCCWISLFIEEFQVFVFRSKKWLVIGLFLIWPSFAGLYWWIPDQFSISDPQRSQNLTPFLKSFFLKVCKSNKEFDAKALDRGCNYVAKGGGINIWSGGVITHRTTAISIYFSSYSEHKLRLRYQISKLWVVPLDKNRSLETGVATFDLAGYESDKAPVLAEFSPTFEIDGNEVATLSDVPKLDEMLSVEGWGDFLTGNLLGIESDQTRSNFSSGAKSFFPVKLGPEFLQLRNFFENGSLTERDFTTFLYFSGAMLSCTALGDVVPTSSVARFFTMFEGLLGIVFFGLLIGAISDDVVSRPSNEWEEGRRPIKEEVPVISES